MATKKFVENFNLVAKHYKCPEDEIKAMKAAARSDMVNAEISFRLLAEQILEEQKIAA